MAVAIVAVVGFLYFHDPDFFKKLQAYGYLGAFVISVVLNATIIIPVSNMAVIIALGATMPLPWLVGVVGGLGRVSGR